MSGVKKFDYAIVGVGAFLRHGWLLKAMALSRSWKVASKTPTYMRSMIPRGGMIKEHEAGKPTADGCRKNGLSQGTFYKFMSQYGGMEVSDATTLRAVFASRTDCTWLSAKLAGLSARSSCSTE